MAVAGDKRLGWWLVFCVVYADIGTSVFYVPGILWSGIGNLAALAQIITIGVFVTIALKYASISARCPDGGGVVSITTQAFPARPWLSLVGGSMITIDYFLTSAISGIAGIYYMQALWGFDKHLAVPITILILFLLLVLNVVGLRESAQVAAGAAFLMLVSSTVLVAMSVYRITAAGAWGMLFEHMVHPGGRAITGTALIIGYADTWLAYSGLESGAQLSGAMRPPVRRTARVGMWAVVFAISFLSPTLTAFSTFMVSDAEKVANPEAFIALLARGVGGQPMMWATVIAGTALLVMACNTALVGNYHVNVRLVQAGYLPPVLAARHPRFGTPHISIAVSAVVPMVVLVLTGGRVESLGDLYSFGLLGTLTLSSLSLDLLRWRERKRGSKFWLGAFTTLALATAWAINIFNKPHALAFGGGLSALIVGAALAYRRGWLSAVFPRVPLPATTMTARGLTAEALEKLAAAHPEAARVLTVEEAKELQPLEGSRVLIAVRGRNPRLLEDAAVVARGLGEKNVYIVFVDEVPGLYYPPDTGPSPEANLVLAEAAAEMGEKYGITGIPLWRISSDAAAALADAADKLGAQVVMLGTSKRSALWKFLRGEVLAGLLARLPEDKKLFIAN